MVKLNLIAAACENMGIGKNGTLPWRLKTEMEFFTRMTSTTKDKNKKNIVIMGRKTWDSIPPKYKPLSNRINCVLSRSDLDVKRYKDVHAFRNLEECIEKLEGNDFRDRWETVWVIGGSNIYKESMESEHFYRLYLTKILKEFDCDTFFPKMPDNLKKVSDPKFQKMSKRKETLSLCTTSMRTLSAKYFIKYLKAAFTVDCI
ncbi:hypothetical protein NQ318_005438 [Aromia moschata]|uniref:dihydrofolate reductase n=1 Tax=Aromia moschata TaxID=1265417 RepID=A0AAV8YYN4_9CUCU|nr:hypothetical protein NQ318_005438 [Aromia moschata]